MFSFLPAPIKGTLAFILFILNTLFWSLFLYPFALLKMLIPHKAFRRWTTRIMIGCAENWIDGNEGIMALTQNMEWDVQGLKDLDYNQSYLVSSNHQSWIDIVVLQHVFNRRIPFLRFFLKQQLLYVPVLGGAWWALDFPFMKRYSRQYLEKHPEKRGRDLAATKKACARFRGTPVSVLNFLEGTRFTPEKHAKQNSHYKNLLKPRAGGLAFVLDAMGDQFSAFLDVTIYYPYGAQSLWGLLSGQVPKVVVLVEQRTIPIDLKQGDYMNDPEFRKKMQAWVNALWQEKDHKIEICKQRSTTEDSQA